MMNELGAEGLRELDPGVRFESQPVSLIQSLQHERVETPTELSTGKGTNVAQGDRAVDGRRRGECRSLLGGQLGGECR